jgi:hypothetical protein
VNGPDKDLIGVKSEKEPVDGTCPERLLFERSLHFHDNNIIYLFNT